MKYNFRYYKDKRGGYYGNCIELKGCHSEGMTINEIKKNLKEALDLYLDEPAHSNLIQPMPKRKLYGSNIIRVQVDPKIALAMIIRQYRLSHSLTQRAMAKKLNKGLGGYQKLEKSTTANPTLTTLATIKNTFPDIMIEKALLE